MSIRETQGICPHCEQQGPAGGLCPEILCQKKGYHFVSSAYYETLGEEARDPAIGLSIRDFIIVKLLGVGGFGRVYLAVEPAVGLKSALKVMDLAGLTKNVASQVREKFALEVRALALLQHPNILRLMHFGTFQEKPYLLTEYIEGGVNLEDEVERRASNGVVFSVRDLKDIFRQLLDGLKAAHSRNIIHRDIKPANLMIQNNAGYPNFLRILDFGLAKFLDLGDVTVAASGTPDYMAPEQLTRESLGPWTDLYAVGTIAYELISGRRPFVTENIQETFYQKVDPSFDPTAKLRDLSLPREVVNFLQRALASDIGKRYQNVEAFRSGLYRSLGVLADSTSNFLSKMTYLGLSRTATVADTQVVDLLKPSPEERAASPTGDVAFRKWIEREQNRLFRQKKKMGPGTR